MLYIEELQAVKGRGEAGEATLVTITRPTAQRWSRMVRGKVVATVPRTIQGNEIDNRREESDIGRVRRPAPTSAE